MTHTETYFSRRANNYSARSLEGVWGIFRKQETQAFEKALKEISYSKVVDLFCGDGYYTRIIMQKQPTICCAIDSCQEMIDSFTVPGVAVYRADAQTFTPDFSPDLILCCGGLEFINDADSFFLHLRSYASSNSSLVILTPRFHILGMIYILLLSLQGERGVVRSSQEIIDSAMRTSWKLQRAETTGLLSSIFVFTTL